MLVTLKHRRECPQWSSDAVVVPTYIIYMFSVDIIPILVISTENRFHILAHIVTRMCCMETVCC